MEPVISKLKRTRLFAQLSDAALKDLIAVPGVESGAAGEAVIAEPTDLVVLLEGGLSVTSADRSEVLAACKVPEAAADPAILYTIPAGAHLTLTEASVYVLVDGQQLDELLSDKQEVNSIAALGEVSRERIASLMNAQLFKQMPFEHLVRCAEAMQEVEVRSGEDVVTQGAPGDYFYVIKAGSAEVWRADAGTEPVKLATLGPGASFGEEALLKGEARNATVRMTAPGRVLKLGKEDFDRLLKSQFLFEITPGDARRDVDVRGAVFIDCRFEEEWEVWRLRNARLVPLDEIRERSRGLDPKREYIVYCRTGRRSRAAAFLMRQSGLNAFVLKGGIAEWPYERETGEVQA
jgi:rhodanese-related sulfurtransferase/signal-transduction protein with cAMP-binding, CBS, and nucleotidyltransferase domain